MFSIGVWVTTNLIKSPGLFLVLWPISTMQVFGWSPLVLLFPSPLIPVLIIFWLYRVHRLQLVSPSPSSSIVYYYLTPWEFFTPALVHDLSLESEWQQGFQGYPFIVLNHSILSTTLYFPSVWIIKCNIYTTKNTTKIRICEIYIGNPEICEIGSAMKLFITFLSLRFFDMRWERHNFLLCWLFVHRQFSTHWLNKRAAHFVDPNWSRLGELWKSTCFVQAQISTLCFFSNSKFISFRARRHSRPRSHFLPGVFIATYVFVTSVPRAREHLHSMCTPN